MALKYAGWPTTAGVPDTNPGTWSTYDNPSDRTYTRRWTATEAGAITGVNIRPSTATNADLFVVVYKQTGGTGDIDKIAQMDIGGSYSQDVWTGYETAVAFGAESLSFESGDILWFGVAFDGATGIGGLQQDTSETSGEVNNQFNSSAVNPTTGPVTPMVFSTSGTNRGLATIVRYETGQTLNAEGGSFTFTGGSITNKVTHKISAAGNLFAMAGGDTTLSVVKKLSTDGSAFTFTGGDASLSYGRSLIAEGGSFVFTGGDIEFATGGPTLSAEGGVFTFTGGSAAFTYTRDSCVVLSNDYYGVNILKAFNNNIVNAHRIKIALDAIEYDIKLNACNIINPTVETIQFDTDYVASIHTEGLLHWDDDSKTLALDLETSGVELQIGQELHVRCTNKTGITITDGQVVYVDGAQGQRPTIALADADDGVKAGRTIGMATHDIADNATGYVTVTGLVNGVDTLGMTEGAPLYVSSTAGYYTEAAPSYPQHIMRVGYIIYAHATEGKILVSTQKGQHLEHLYEVDVDTNLTNGQILKYDSGQWFNKDIYLDTVGFEDRTESTMAFTDLTRTFTIEPTVTDYKVYTGGESITKDSQESVVITDTEGLWYIYFENDGTLTASQIPWDFFSGKIFIAYVYWDAVSNKALAIGEERHGASMSPATHHYAHDSRGSVWIHGATPSVIADGSGALDSHAELQSISISEMYDEDIVNDGEEQLSYEIWYKDGSSADWRKTTASAALVDITTTRPNWNEWTGTVWQRTEVDNTKFMLVHQFLTNAVTRPNILIMGENQYNSKGDAQDGAQSEIATLTSGELPSAEFIDIATFIIECKDSLTNSYNARVVSTSDGGDFIDFRINEKTGVGATATDHGNLAGLTDDDHPQYPNIDDTETITGAWTFDNTIHFNDASDYITRQVANAGYFVGSWNISDNSSYTNPIFTIGTAFLPALTTLANMHGIGYTHATSASFINSTDLGSSPTGWGMYVTAGGISRVFLDSGTGNIHNSGDLNTAGAVKGASAVLKTSVNITNANASSWPFISNTNGSNHSGFYFSSGNDGQVLLRDSSGTLTVNIHAGATSIFTGSLKTNSTLSADKLIITGTAPTAYNSAGSNGQIAVGNGYLYAHNGTRWGRVLLDFTTTW